MNFEENFSKELKNETNEDIKVLDPLPEILEKTLNYEENTEQNSCFLGETPIHSQNIIDNTPFKDSKNSLFKKGVTYTSTPLPENIMKSFMKQEFDLSIIKEEDENSCTELNEAKVTITRNVPSVNDCHLNNLQDIKNTDTSVFKRDEISLLELPQRNVTQTVNDLQLVVYKDIVNKTLDDLLVHDQLDTKELNNVETEGDRKEILSKAIALKEYISSNEDENKDNNDPEWELLKMLETDDERYKAVRKIWRNLAIPDLKQNLSTLNWRRRNALPAMKNIAPIVTTEIDKNFQNLTYNCSEVFDTRIKKLKELLKRQVCGIRCNEDNNSSVLASVCKRPRHETRYNPMTLDYQSRLRICIEERINRHHQAIHEINAVHQFYNGLKNQGNGGYGNTMLINYAERQNIMDIENTIDHYRTWYPDQ